MAERVYRQKVATAGVVERRPAEVGGEMSRG